MGDGIDLTVTTFEGCHQQCAAAKTLGIAHGGNSDIDRLSGSGKSRERRGHHHGRHVLQLQAATRWQRDTELGQHIDHALHRKRCLRRLVPTPIQTHYQASADKLIAAHTLDRNQILDAFGMRSARKHQQYRQQCEQAVFEVGHFELFALELAVRTG